ncbi:MAG: glutathione transferase GstA [Burkholderiales bacterium]
MKLYYTPGACSMAVHIVLREAGVPFELEKVDLRSKRTQGGEDYVQINPKGYVPALRLEDGSVLTEVGVCVQYVADLAPQTDLAPVAGTMARYRLMEWINFISTEIHKTFGPLFDPSASGELRERQIGLLGKRFDYIAEHLTQSGFLTGDKFTAADAYLFTVLNWTHVVKVDASAWPRLQAYVKRVAERPAVRETMKTEGLIK